MRPATLAAVAVVALAGCGAQPVGDATDADVEQASPSLGEPTLALQLRDISAVEPEANALARRALSGPSTSVPSLQFLRPPGGSSVRVSPTNVRYMVVFRATDTFGGTTIKLYYAVDEGRCGGTGAICTANADCGPTQVCRHDLTMSPFNFIGELQKYIPGTIDLSIGWNIHGIPDGFYVVFAELVPGAGIEGIERSHTEPEAGQDNVGNGTLGDVEVNIAEHKARLESWSVVNVDAEWGKWLVTSSLSQPEPADPPQAPLAYIATTGVTYTSVGDEIQFRLTAGTVPFEAGDRFDFTTTGITPVSASVLINEGSISEDPRAVIAASPLSGPPPLTVNFDGRGSHDPNGDPLEYRWNFGDGSDFASGAVVSHTYSELGEFIAVLRVTNSRTGRLDEAFVIVTVAEFECQTDEECDDGVACNGTEHCLDNDCVGDERPCDDADGVGCSDLDATESCEEGEAGPICDWCRNVTIGACETSVPDQRLDDGRTMNRAVDDCRGRAVNHGRYVKCIADLARTWRDDGQITGKEYGHIIRCAATGPIPHRLKPTRLGP